MSPCDVMFPVAVIAPVAASVLPLNVKFASPVNVPSPSDVKTLFAPSLPITSVRSKLIVAVEPYAGV